MPASTRMKRVLYLDIDGVLMRYPDRDQFESEDALLAFYASDSKLNNGRGPNNVREFLRWAHEHFECRWLSAWAMSGDISARGRARLIERLDVAPWMIARVRPNLGWSNNKCEGIDWTEHDAGIEWFWLDDDAHAMPREVNELERRGARDRLITVNTSADPDGLTKARAEIERRLAEAKPPIGETVRSSPQ